MTEKQTPEAVTIDEDPIIMDGGDALRFLGKLIERGCSDLELYTAATTIKVKRPSKSVSTEESGPRTSNDHQEDHAQARSSDEDT
jgi:hypothetical protein